MSERAGHPHPNEIAAKAMTTRKYAQCQGHSKIIFATNRAENLCYHYRNIFRYELKAGDILLIARWNIAISMASTIKSCKG